MGENKSGQTFHGCTLFFVFLRSCYSNICTRATTSTGSSYNHECHLL